MGLSWISLIEVLKFPSTLSLEVNKVGENGWNALDELEDDGEGRTRYFELRKGGTDRIDDILEEAIESVGDCIDYVSKYWYIALLWFISQLGERGIGTAFSFECIDRRAVLQR